MRVDFSNRQFQSDEVQQYVRVAPIARAAIGAAIVGAIGFMVVASLPSSVSERGLIDASVNEMQLYALPALQGSERVQPESSAGAAVRAVDDEFGSLAGVVDHG
ncbi:MAG: hypothetical protein ACXW16_09040 [Burkholderiaceae bacterium]